MTTFFKGRNRAFAQLSGGINGSVTNIPLVTGQGARLTQVLTASGDKVRAQIIERDEDGVVIACELVDITNNVSDVLTVTRAIEATRTTDSTNTYSATGRIFTSAAYIEEVISSAVVTQMQDAINARLELGGGAMTGPILQKKSSNIASATTTDLSTMTGDSGHITGTTTIVGLGTAQAGTQKEITFDGILTLTHNATSLILPGGVSIITAANDTATFISEGSGNWRCTDYQKASGAAVVAAATITGEIRAWTTGTAPSGFVLCDGTAISRTTYANLFAVIGTVYGAGNGSTTFNVPNLKGKVVAGFDSGQAEFDTLWETWGSNTQALTTANLPSHTHGQRMPATSAGSSDTQMVLISVGGAVTGSQMTVNSGPTASKTQISTDAAGSGSAHNNLQPYMALNYIIAT